MNLVISTEFPALLASDSDVSPQASLAFPAGGSVTRFESMSSATSANSQTTLSCQQPEGLTFDTCAGSEIP